jgi:hypothetical protein
MAKLRVKRAASLENPTLQSGELGVIENNLYFGRYQAGDALLSATKVANQNANNNFTGVSSFLPSSTNDPNVMFYNYSVSPASTIITSVKNGRLHTVDPTEPDQVATKNYVDGRVQGLDIKDSVLVATNGPITLSGYQVINDVNLNSPGLRVLVKDQEDSKENGIYIVSSGQWQRASDADEWSKLISAFVFVEQGTQCADTGWVCKADLGGYIGTGDIEWTQFSGAGSFTPGYGLIVSGTQFSINTTETMDLSSAQSVRGIKTFNKSTLKMKGTSSGTTTISTANTSPTSYTLTLPAKDGILAVTDDLHKRSHEMTSTSDHTAGPWKMFYSNGSRQVVEIPLSSTSGYVLKSNGPSADPTWQADNNTTYSAAATGGLKLTGTEFSLNVEAPITGQETGQVLVQDSNGVLYGGFLAYTASNNTLAVNATSATKASHLVGGNSTTLLGAIPYQSNTDTTTLLEPNRSTTKKYLRMVGDGSNGAAPEWEEINIPPGFVLTSNILQGSLNSLNPYSDRIEGKLYVNDTPPTPMGNKAPTSTEWHLGFDGIFYATKFEGIIDGGVWQEP